MSSPIPYFDGHNDALFRLWRDKSDTVLADFLNGSEKGHIDLPRARTGHFVGGLFAVFSPSPRVNLGPSQGAMNVALPPLLPPEEAWAAAKEQIAVLFRLIAASEGRIVLCKSVADIRTAIANNQLAVVLHMEGVDAIDESLDLLEVLYQAGLRSLGPVWSRPNAFGHGVPMQFPNSPDIGPGLTEAGKRLVRECNRLKIMIDLSHMNEKGFWDVAELSDAPLIATHSNVHAISASPRNLTARQLDAIRDSDGFVGLNFATSYLRDDGQMRADTGVEWLVRHLDGLIEKLGEGRVGIGSDFDGAVVPAAIGSVAGITVLFDALR
ncbi:MAG TPA: dipeptidase, partial [Devosiaceae bacterium]|nr:dipeptidase [Devosiaceae bacterium]